MKIEVGKVYYTAKYNEMFKCVNKNPNQSYPMNVIYADGTDSAYMENLSGYEEEFITYLGDGEIEDYPEYLL